MRWLADLKECRFFAALRRPPMVERMTEIAGAAFPEEFKCNVIDGSATIRAMAQRMRWHLYERTRFHSWPPKKPFGRPRPAKPKHRGRS